VIEGLLTLPVIVPVIFWAAYHYHKDRHLPEPPGHLLLVFALGIGASWLSARGYEALGLVGLRFDAVALADSDPLGLFAYSMLVIGPLEELAKLLPFVIVALRFQEFDEPIDGIIYASFIGLGYAAAENVHYLQFLTPAEAAMRGFAGPVVHMLFASIWGYWIGMAYVRKRSILGCGLAGFAIAAGLHGLYDFVVLLHPVNALPIAALLIVIIWIWRLKLMHALHLDAVEASQSAERRH
jgi:RsiW-degrading membrane proteinase PrsW (M82 family)